MASFQDVVGVAASKAGVLLSAIAGVVIAWRISHVIYNLFFHPLRDVPGPLLQRASRLPWAFQHISGRQAFITQKLHDHYGPVVRIGPNHLSFTDAHAWKDIYGHLVGHKSGSPEMDKASDFLRVIDDIPTSILNSDREEHGRLRRALAHGFSDASMRNQNHMIMRHVDLLIQRLHELCGNGKTPHNMEAWYNWTTFDIAGDLIFGEAFGCLENVCYHPSIAFILKTVQWGAYMVVLCYLGLRGVVQFIYRNAQGLAITEVQKMNDAMVQRRLDMKEPRDDLFEGVVKRREEWDLSLEKLSANAFILVLAGSETTATTLSGVTYLLLTHPAALQKLSAEVRSSFKSADEINISSVNKLNYMLAVLTESLRMYPPVTAGLVRQVPAGGAYIAGQYVAENTLVEVQHWSINHSKENWEDPWTFNPERFLNKEGDKKPSGEEGGDVFEALQAFSVGPRNCIGRNLAYAEMRLILARIVYDFDLRLADDSRNWVERQKAYTLWDRIPLNVYLTPVQK